ncbi:VOC family protein [Hydrogenophaga sp. D2P1]|uniref:VOC family protein n=1 Tax=Hydrogenophaga aromaticivorans TaxID=2610898 RepID=A0A7Y8KXA5_9BURK|nr:VOC family protein [Hydrogenophaga aromaticivorans]NWF46395.1 VOC family protein [Hydrogenophaga aromaticivorans]
MSNAKGDFIWYELLTTDADAAQRFYGDVVGWTASDSGQPGMDYRILDAGDGQAGGLMQINEQMPGAKPVWLGYVGVPDVDAAVADWTAAGGSVQMPMMDIPKVGRIAMLADPDGVPLYVMRGASDEVSTAFRVADARHVRWNEIAVKDDKASLAFYQVRFGWTVVDTMPMGEQGDYHLLAANGVRMGALMRSPVGQEPRWLYYFGVEDIDAAVEQIKAGGGQVLDGPHQIPGGEYSLHARDPQGAAFGLVGPRIAPR